MSSKLNIEVSAQTTQAQKNIQNISEKIDELASRKNSITGVSLSIAAIGTAYNTVKGAVQEVIKVTSEWVNLYKTQELNTKRLDVIVKNLGTAAALTTEQLTDYASALQAVTRFGDETIIAAEQILVETGKLGKDGLKRAIELSLDLAEAMGTDATSGAQTLALALQDPETGLRRLRQAHVLLSDAEEQAIKNLIAEGKELDAQNLILDKVAATYGGLAREVASLDTSKVDRLGNLWGDFKENLGGMLINKLSPVLDDLLEKMERINGIAAAATQQNAPLTQEEIDRYKAALTGDYAAAVKGLSIDDFRGLLAELTDAKNQAAEVMGGSTLRALDEELESLQKSLKSYGTMPQVQRAIQTRVDLIEQEKKAINELDIPTATASYNALKTAIEGVTGAYNDYLESLKPAPKTATVEEVVPVDPNAPEIYAADVIDRAIIKVGPTPELEGGADIEVPAKVTIIPEDGDIRVGRSFKEVADAVLKFFKDNWSELLNGAGQAFDSIMGLADQLYSNQISALDKELSAEEERWAKYFDNLDKQYDKQKKALDAMYESGQISAEEYEAELKKTDEERVKSEAEKEAELEKLQQKKQALERKQFEANKANQIAQATISGAQSIAGIWASYGASPILAGTLTALSAASIGAQIATIASQQYVPALADGGIVSKPTLALIGEAGPEAVVPLSKGKGLAPTIVVQVENVYTSDDLSEAVYEGISKLQRTGALPAWS